MSSSFLPQKQPRILDQSTALETLFGEFAERFRTYYDGNIDAVVIAGSGLSGIMAHHTLVAEVDMEAISGFPIPAVQGHGHTIRILEIHTKRVAFVGGRCHLYEGHPMVESVAVVGMFAVLGVRHIVITNSAGGLNPHFAVGDVMAATDFLNMMQVPVLSSLGIVEHRHAVVSHIHHEWLQRVLNLLAYNGEVIHRGVYTGVLGPSYETPAEIRMFKIIGGDAVGMSTVHEAEFACWCGMQVLSCSLISNLLKETSTELLSHHDVVVAANIGAGRTAKFIEAAIASIME